jgi:putative ABC transport system ATP-binding protein
VTQPEPFLADDALSEGDYALLVEGVKKYFYMGDTVVKACDGIDLAVKRGEYVSIMGPSGSGKTTLFNIVGGLEKPSNGQVYIDKTDISKLDAYELAWLRCRKIGYVFQSFNLVPIMTALQNVTLPMIFAGFDLKERNERGSHLLDMVGLADRLHHKPTELSGGQQQRVAIARAFANGPAIVLADEPTGNLDLQTGREIIDLLKELNVESGVTVISATHDLKMIDVSDRVVHIRDGQVERVERRADLKLDVGSMGEH